jgi:hypothetical protein
MVWGYLCEDNWDWMENWPERPMFLLNLDLAEKLVYRGTLIPLSFYFLFTPVTLKEWATRIGVTCGLLAAFDGGVALEMASSKASARWRKRIQMLQDLWRPVGVYRSACNSVKRLETISVVDLEITPYANRLLKRLKLGSQFPAFGFRTATGEIDNEMFLQQFSDVVNLLETSANEIRVNPGWVNIFEQRFKTRLSLLEQVRSNGDADAQNSDRIVEIT